MSAIDGVMLTVGLTAILLSLVALYFSNKWSQAADCQLQEANQALAELRSESDSIVRAVEQRLDDMVRRTIPSVKETTEAQMIGQLMPTFMEAILSGKLDATALERLSSLNKS